MQLIIATKNKNKIREIRELLGELDVNILSLEDLPDMPDVVENGETFKDNALKKARSVSRHYGMPAVADDSGLAVDYLNGAPGVYSARFSGENVTYKDNNTKLLELMKDVPQEKRKARFICVIALARDGYANHTFTGTCNGSITTEEIGSEGFGYDPVFFFPPLKKTFAEISLKKKNTISHRSQALRKLKTFLQNNQDYLL